MTKSSLHNGWRTVKFGDLAESITERVDDPKAAGVEIYVGLEHLDSDTTKISRFGTPEDVESTKLRFYPGDVIYARRRAYQRKLGVAEVEGICSAHALVLRARREVCLPEFLPYFLQSDQFHERALSISVGSLSPTINWKTLVVQEFVLPPIAKQHRIVLLLGESTKVVNEYESVLPFLQTLKSSLWMEMMDRSDRDSVVRSLGSLISLEYGKALKEAHRVEGNVPVYGSAGAVGFHDKCVATAERNIVVGRKGSAGSITVVESPCWVIDTAYFVHIKDGDLEFDFVKEMLLEANLSELNTQTAVPGLNREEVYRKKVVLPNSATRSEYLAKFGGINTLMLALERQLAEAKSLQAVLREQILLAGQDV